MKKLLVTLAIAITICACSKEDTPNRPADATTPPLQSACDATTIINADLYQNTTSGQVNIHSLKIEDNCLKINYSASGCDGNSWEIKLIDAAEILESYPPQRNLKLSIKNEELCDAVITKETSFDISNLKLDENKVVLNITDFDQGILFEY